MYYLCILGFVKNWVFFEYYLMIVYDLWNNFVEKCVEKWEKLWDNCVFGNMNFKYYRIYGYNVLDWYL